MQIAWRVLVALGGLLILAALQMDTTVGQVHNLGLLQQRQMLMILGCALGLAGVILFGLAKLKQLPEEQRQENQQGLEAANAAGAAVQTGLEKSGLAVANAIVGLKPGTDLWGARMAVGLLSGCAWSLAGGLASHSGALATVLLVLAFAFAFWPAPAATVLSRLSVAHLGLTLVPFGIFYAITTVQAEQLAAFSLLVAISVVLPFMVAALCAAYARRRSPRMRV